MNQAKEDARLVVLALGALFFVAAIVIVPSNWTNALGLFLAYAAGYSYRSALD